MTANVSDYGLTYGAAGNLAAAHQLYPIGASVGSNAMTITLDPCVIGFRSTSLTSGTPVAVNVANQISLTIPTGATLGAINATAARFVVLAINNAGTVELAVVNISGGTALDETNLISTTAITSGSTSASTVYSAGARSNVAYKVVGIVDNTQATAGTYATAPSLVAGAGGNALDSMGSLGYGQTYQNVVGSRAAGTTYYNTTGRPITVSAVWVPSGNIVGYAVAQILVNGAVVWQRSNYHGTDTTYDFIPPTVVPPGASYSIAISGTFGTLNGWYELR